MTQELTQQWLAQIQALKQQVAELQAEREAWLKSAEKWQKLYNAEAQGRRTDAQMSQQAIASLKAEIQKLRLIESAPLNDTTAATAIHQEIEPLQSVEALKAKLIVVIKERDHARSLLKTEQDNHAQTRKSLTTALGDAIDRLTHERGVRSEEWGVGSGD